MGMKLSMCFLFFLCTCTTRTTTSDDRKWSWVMKGMAFLADVFTSPLAHNGNMGLGIHDVVENDMGDGDGLEGRLVE